MAALVYSRVEIGTSLWKDDPTHPLNPPCKCFLPLLATLPHTPLPPLPVKCMTHINVVTGVNEFRGLLMPHTLASLHRNQRITMCVIMTQLQNTKKLFNQQTLDHNHCQHPAPHIGHMCFSGVK